MPVPVRYTNPRRHLYVLSIPAGGISSLTQTHLAFEHQGSMHVHESLIQVFFVLGGSMQVNFEESEHIVSPGEGIIMERNRVHRVGGAPGFGHVDLIDLRVTAESPNPLHSYLDQPRETPLGHAPLSEMQHLAEQLRAAGGGVGARQNVRPDVMAAVWTLLDITFAHAQPSPPEIVWPDPRLGVVDSLLRENLANTVSVPIMASWVQLSPGQLNRLFTRYLDQSPSAYLRTLRLDKASELLTYSTLSIAQIAQTCGFPNANHFSRVFHEFRGQPPTAFRASRPRPNAAH